MRGRGFIAAVGTAVVAAGTIGLAGPAPVSAATCATGTWRVQDVSLDRTVKTPYGKLRFAPVAGGTVRLTIGATNTWSVTIDKAFRASGALPVGSVNGTVTVTGSANGTYKSKRDTSVVIRLSAGSGSATFSGTVNGLPLSFSYPVKSGDVQQYLGIKGKAFPTCTPGGLTLRYKLATLTLVAA